MVKTSINTHFTSQVQLVLANISGKSSLRDSVIERAVSYFYRQKIHPENAPVPDDELEVLTQERVQRQLHLHCICLDILALCEGESFEETNRKSAQLLGTIQLISPTEGLKVTVHNDQCKALYKAVLSLRLLDKLCINKEIEEPYIKAFLGNITSEQYESFSTIAPENYQRFVTQVKVPLIMAAILQDIGNHHSDAQLIIRGKDNNQDPFRALDIEARKKLLQINYKQTVKYLTEGIGAGSYIGNSRTERDDYIISEKEKLAFIKHILKSSINPKESIGNLLKVPQIYTSIILSTKSNYNYKLLPKVYQVLNMNAERGHCSQRVVNAFYQVTGMFPQGFGIVCMPNDFFVETGDCYEYAIVNQLYPENPEEPVCRMATRKLSFISFGHNVIVKQNCNLYFSSTAKKLANISKYRLNEILELLASDFRERKKLDLLPRCWQASEFFSIRKNQKLWNVVR